PRARERRPAEDLEVDAGERRGQERARERRAERAREGVEAVAPARGAHRVAEADRREREPGADLEEAPAALLDLDQREEGEQAGGRLVREDAEAVRERAHASA